MVTTVNKHGTWAGVFGRRSKLVKEIADDLRARIVGLHPDVVEVPRKDDKVVSFGFGEKKLSEVYCSLAPQTGHVVLGFPWGVSLDDPNGLLEGSGKKLRQIKIDDQHTSRSAKISHLLHLALTERSVGLEQDAAAKKVPAKKAPAKKRAAKKENA